MKTTTHELYSLTWSENILIGNGQRLNEDILVSALDDVNNSVRGISLETSKLVMEVQAATWSLNELLATVEAHDNKYHPIIRFILRMIGKI
jgi:hypothetical protein